MLRALLLLFSIALLSCQTTDRAIDYKTALEKIKNNKEVPITAPLSILQGATDANSTQINVLTPQDASYQFRIFSSSSEIDAPLLTTKTYPSSHTQVIQLTIRGLELGETYRLDVVNAEHKLLDYRYFKALDPAAKTTKLAVVSCTDDHFPELQAGQWNLVWSQKPDLLLMIGDNIYVDSGRKPGQTEPVLDDHFIWKRYVESRAALQIYKMKTLIPTLASWDDHDYGKNNSDRNFPFKKESKIIFETFFPQETNAVIIQKGPGTSQLVHYAGADLVFFDDRFFRSEKESSEQTHFGREQEKWFYQILKERAGPFWLISGDQFFGGYHKFESYEGDHPESFKKFLNQIKKSKRKVAFISGDRHVAEVMKIPKDILGYETYELTSSGLHAKVFPGSLAKEKPNTRSIFGKDGTYHFMLLEFLNPSKEKEFSFKVFFLDSEGKAFYQNQFKVNQ